MPGGKRDVLRGADFNSTTTLDGFFVDSGSWNVTGGALSVAAASLGKDAASVFAVDSYLPIYYEIAAAVQSRKPTSGWKANAYIIFDYFSPTDFKFTGIDISTNKLVMGQRTTSGWNVGCAHSSSEGSSGTGVDLVTPSSTSGTNRSVS